MSKDRTLKPKTNKSINEKPKSKKAKPKATTKKPGRGKTDKLKKKKSFITELIENVEEGARIVTGKTSEFATETFEKVKKGASEVIDSSSQVVSDLYDSASEYTEQFKDKIEMRRLNSRRGELESDLGRYFYKKYKVDKVIFSKFSKSREFLTLLKNIEKLDEEIVELGEHFSK